ncbi:MAG: TonB-dependent receptor [Bacteroidetes bacterium]|nr:TonB-dependent receptor [Bacteroidota bacterium]
MLRLFFILLIAAPAAAQTTDAPVAADTTLPGVTVTATRIPVPSRDAPARVTLLGADAIDAANATSIADLLESRAPLFLRRYGSSGLASVTLRGSSASQTLILLDGRRLADPQLGQIDLSLLPTVMLESVEVLHGGGSALYGTDALGGVVHLRSIRSSESFAARMTSEVGAWGQQRIGGVVSGQSGGWSGVVAVEGENADEDFFYHDLSLIGEPLVRNRGWDRDRLASYGAVTYSSGPTSLRSALMITDAERGLGGTDSVGARQWDRTMRFWLDGTQQTRWGCIEVGGYVQRSSLRYASPFPSTRPDALDETGRTTTASFDVRAHLTRFAGWHLTGDITVGAGTAEHPSLSADASDTYAALAVTAAQTTGRLRIYPALRLDGYSPSEGEQKQALSPQLGLNWRPFETEAFRVKASAGRAFRMPTFNDRFWQPGGNPDLLPESGWTADAGLVWSSNRTHAELTIFAATARNQIVWQPTAQGFYAPENLSKTRSFGIEASLNRTWLFGRNTLLETGVVATFTDARDRSNPAASSYDQQLRYVPKWTAKAWASATFKALRFDLGLRAVGRRYTTTDASQSLDPYLVLDGQVRYIRMIGPIRTTLALAAENLTSLQYEVIQSYVMPPRHLRVRLILQTQ